MVEHKSQDGRRAKEELNQNNNQQAVETVERADPPEEKLYSCRISGCREDPKTFGNSWSFLDHLEADHGYSEAKLKETGQSQGCKVARHLKEVFGKDISLPSNLNSTVRPDQPS